MELVGCSAIVTGGASGLGEATVRALAAAGAHVVVLDLQQERGMSLALEVKGTFALANVTDQQAVQAAVNLAVTTAPLRVLVNCAGLSRVARTVNRRGEPFDLAAFDLVLQTNLVGTFNCIRLAAAAMSRQDPMVDGERGAIVNTASLAAFDGQVGQAAYTASKAGIVGLTLPVARDLAPHGIRINTIAPGLFDTPIYGSGDAAEAFKQRLQSDLLFPRRLGRADEFAALALAILTNSYMNGEVVRLDGAVRLSAG